MACGCGGECCKQPKGLGFLYNDGAGSSWDEYNYDEWYDGGGYDDLQQGLDWWSQLTGGYDPNVYDVGFVDAQVSEPGGAPLNENWVQDLVDWWRDFTGGYTGEPIQPTGGGYDAERGLPGYCPAGYYHPLNDPYICVPFPDETPAERNQRQIAAAKAQAAQKAAQAAAKAQQAAQPCPPNTGLVKNAQGQCACPNGYAFSKTYGKCVLVSQLTAEDKKALESTDWWKYLAIGAFALIAVKALKSK